MTKRSSSALGFYLATWNMAYRKGHSKFNDWQTRKAFQASIWPFKNLQNVKVVLIWSGANLDLFLYHGQSKTRFSFLKRAKMGERPLKVQTFTDRKGSTIPCKPFVYIYKIYFVTLVTLQKSKGCAVQKSSINYCCCHWLAPRNCFGQPSHSII